MLRPYVLACLYRCSRLMVQGEYVTARDVLVRKGDGTRFTAMYDVVDLARQRIGVEFAVYLPLSLSQMLIASFASTSIRLIR